MDLFRRLAFRFWYLRRPPWDSGIVPPEVEAYIRNNPPGRALDLGCGTGTSSLALAKAGWGVTGVDFVPRAIRIAREKAKAAGVHIEFHVADVTRLVASSWGNFDLVLDIGCFHGLSPSGKLDYLDQMEHLLVPSGIWLLYGFFKPSGSTGPGLLDGDLENAMRYMTLLRRQDGMDKRGRPSVWLWFQRTKDG